MLKKITESNFRFIVIYILCILVFAIIYCYFSSEFYHSTVKFEKSYIEENNKVISEIKNQILENYKLKYDSTSFKIEHTDSSLIYEEFSINGIQITNLEYELPNINYTISYEIVKSDGKQKIYSRQNIAVSMNCGSSIIQYDKRTNKPYIHIIQDRKENNSEDEILKNVYTLRTQHIKINQDTIPELILKYPPWRDLESNSGKLENRLITTDEVNDRLLYFKSAQDGFPYKINGTFWRLLYFSSTTQTGLGPGDILPLSNRVRFLVVLQIILGLVIMGLFLNSLAVKLSKENHDGRSP